MVRNSVAELIATSHGRPIIQMASRRNELIQGREVCQDLLTTEVFTHRSCVQEPCSGATERVLFMEILLRILLLLLPAPKTSHQLPAGELWSDPELLLLCKDSSAQVRKVILSTTCPRANNWAMLHVQSRAGCCKNMGT